MVKNPFLFAVLSVVLGCAVPPYAVEKGRTAPEDFFGIVPHDLSPDVEKDYALLDDLGTVWWRRTCRWSSLERKQGAWDFSTWDRYVEEALANKKKLLAILAYDTSWIYQENRSLDKITAQELPFFINYVETVVSRYRGKIAAYEIWNEPNMPRFWKGSAEGFAALTLAAVKKIREVDPGAFIVAGALWRVPKNYIRQLFKSGAMDYVDAISFHPYAVNPAGAVRAGDRMIKAMEQYHYGGEIWATEAGYPTGGWYPSRVRENNFPKYIIKTLAGFSVRNIRNIIWYEYKESYPHGKAPSKFNSENFFGLVDSERIPKKGYHAWALCGNYLAGAEYLPAFPKRKNIPDSIVSLCFNKKDLGILIVWDEKAGKNTFSLALPGTEQTMHNIFTREQTFLQAESEITIGGNPLFITWKKSGETPVLTKWSLK